MDEPISPPAPVPPSPVEPPKPPPDPPGPGPANPPAADLVIDGPISESSERARKELEETRFRLRQAELKNMDLEDENQRLKQIPTPPKPKAFGWRPLIG